jgi:peroxisomal enoyl-CoA hydratase 2
MVDDSKLGQVIGHVRLPVEAGKIHEFASAIHDFAPRYRDPAAAAHEGFDAVPAPPTFTVAVNHFPDEALQEAGGILGVLGLDLPRVLGGEQSWTYHRTPVAGDVLDGDIRVIAIERKAGKQGGEMTFVTTEIEFRDSQGEPVVTQRNTVIETAATMGA